MKKKEKKNKERESERVSSLFCETEVPKQLGNVVFLDAFIFAFFKGTETRSIRVQFFCFCFFELMTRLTRSYS